MTAGKRRVFGAAFKAKVALAAAMGDQTTAQLASRFGVNTSQVTAWKKQLMAQVAELFTDGRQRRAEQAADEQELYEQIGRLKMKVEWLKKLPRSAEVKRLCIGVRTLNTDQGAQFTATAFTSRLKKRGVAISMNSRGRALVNVFVKRLWRTVKYEDVYLRDYADGWQAKKWLGRYFKFNRNELPHQALGYRTPSEVYAEQ